MNFFHHQWPIFIEDNHLLALYKPAGLVVQRDQKNKANLLDLVKSWLKVRYDKPGNVFAGMVHRLDGPVAGVMVVARTSKAASRLSAQFRDNLVDKTYLAIVQGHPASASGRLEHHIVGHGRLSRAVDGPVAGGKRATLSYRVVDRQKGQGLMEIKLETGRRHQIRAQMAAEGCPIKGDWRYGAGRSMKYGRIALMARRLAFDHPTRRMRIHLECPVPAQWPWPMSADGRESPLWSIEDFQKSETGLPFDPQKAPIF